MTGSETPVVTNPFTSRKRVALALQVPEAELLHYWRGCFRKRVEPVRVSRAPCQEVVREVDLLRFPVPITWNERDAGPYITFGLFICRNPETGEGNMAIYRIHIKGRNRGGILIKIPGHAATCHELAEQRGEPLEFAVALGAEPALYLASQAPLPFGEDELGFAGALKGKPVELVRCQTVDLEVPASAEIVLEGRILPGVRETEGPFGEWHGYYSGAGPRPVLEFTGVTHRKDPLYLTTYEGLPVYGPTNVMQAVAREPVWYEYIRSYSCPTIRDICFTPGGCSGLHVVVSIRKRVEGQAKNVIADVLRSHSVKHVVVVDDDIDPRDTRQVEWAIATRVQADQDVIIMPGAAGLKIDPSQPHFPSGVGAKMGIDATRPLEREFPEIVDVPEAMRQQVEARWAEYGL
ncbi:MAG: UbiD family decarboxylase [Deltaproteobacteria bacterium]|nr:UbiD family decarboxylase [Deltaproteobacteria bacterium]